MTPEELKEYIAGMGACEVGFSRPPGAPEGLEYAITVVVKLSGYVLSRIDGGPTHAYFQHYRAVNSLIDAIVLRAGLRLEAEGYRYFPIAASQSVNGLYGLFPHKTAARLAGLGFIGKNALFISNRFGCGVRLGTLFTDMPLPSAEEVSRESCGECRLCVSACPAMALKGADFSPGCERSDLIDAKACSDYMKEKFRHIGRGAVCGICMRACPRCLL